MRVLYFLVSQPNLGFGCYWVQIWPTHCVTGSTEVDGPESDQEELDHSSSRDGSDSTLDNFVEQLECHHAPTETKEEYKKESVASIGNLSLGFSGNY